MRHRIKGASPLTRKITNAARRYAVSAALLLTAAALGLCVYAIIQTQDERAASILRECNAQNARHSATVAELKSIVARAEAKAPPVRRGQIEASVSSTLLLIDALAPYRDCQHVLAKSTTK